MPTDTQAKVCIYCSQDCTDRPRIKDSRGNYACKACAASAAAKSHSKADKQSKPSKSATDGMDPIMIELVRDLPDPATESCPSCGRILRLRHILCTHCGYNRETEKQTRQVIEKFAGEGKGKGRFAGRFGSLTRR